jgi:hypothetical protein
MRNGWWMAPVAVLLVLGGVAAGLWLARPRADIAPKGGQVHVPPLPGEPKGSSGKQVSPAPGGGQAPAQPVEPAPATPAAPPAPNRPADSEAHAFVNAFMQARMAGDGRQLAAMVAPGAAGIRVSGPANRITGYTVSLLGSGDPELFVFRLHVAFAGRQPGGEVAAEDLRLTWQGGFRVASFQQSAADSLALGVDKEGKLQLHHGQSTALVGDLATLPAMAKPWGATTEEFGVGKEAWAVAVPSLTGNSVLWVTQGLHSLLGVSTQDAGGAYVPAPMDLLFEAGADEAAWAPGADRHVAVALAQPSGATTLVVYDLAGGQRFGPDLSNVLGTVDYRVSYLRWLRADTVAFDLEKVGAAAGTWTYNVGTRTLKGP